mgnify:CR=1 FL=1
MNLQRLLCILSGGALKIALDKKIMNIKVSISHCRDYAMAYAVAEGGEL